MKICLRSSDPRTPSPGPTSATALLVLLLALPVSCGLSSAGIAGASGSGGSAATGSSSHSGAGGTTTSSSAQSAASSGSGGSGGASSSGSSSSGGAPVIWHSWDVQTKQDNPPDPPEMSVLDTSTTKRATISTYVSISLKELGVDELLSYAVFGLHIDPWNSVMNYWVTNQGSKYPYVGQSSLPRAIPAVEINAPGHAGVFDLQLYPPSDKNKSVVAAFVVPFDGNYTLSELSSHRILGMPGDHAELLVFVDNTPVKTANLQANKDQHWMNDLKSYPLGMLTAGTHINFAVNAVDNDMGDATEIAWTITAN